MSVWQMRDGAEESSSLTMSMLHSPPRSPPPPPLNRFTSQVPHTPPSMPSLQGLASPSFTAQHSPLIGKHEAMLDKLREASNGDMRTYERMFSVWQRIHASPSNTGLSNPGPQSEPSRPGPGPGRGSPSSSAASVSWHQKLEAVEAGPGGIWNTATVADLARI